jgi:hypothetical protein
MRVLFVFSSILALTSLACGAASVKAPAPLSDAAQIVSPASSVSSVIPAPVISTLTSTATPRPATPSSTPDPAGTIFVANSEKPQDSCAAGVRNGTDSADGDPMDKLGSNPILPELQTLVPGLDATLQTHPSGPAGMGPGKGDQVGKRITFAPFLSEMPAYCDPELADQN